MRSLYPTIEPFACHSLEVQSPHILHIAEYGSSTGIPVLFLHGGPGAGCDDNSARFFDPALYHIITFDQRGCGKSTPHACLENNTTADLIDDIERIRQFLNIESWVIFGGSWGSTLALAYAQAQPCRALGLILRGIFLCRPSEIHWFYQYGASLLFPDYWEDFIAPIPEEERYDLVNAFYKHLTTEDPLIQITAAKAWSNWEGKTSTLYPNAKIANSFLDDQKALSMARIECHYFMNDAFLEPNQLLHNMYRIADIPGIIVHGRYDVVCPINNAWQVHKAWPISKLTIIDSAGHSAFEEATTDALVQATDDIAKLLLTPEE